MVAIKWIGGQSNRIASVVRAFMYMAVALSWTQLTTEQIGTILLFTEAFLGLFVETNTMSKVRAAERIDEVKKVEAVKTEAAIEEVKKATGTGSGIFPPTVLLALALSGSLLFSGCASGMHGAAKAEDVAHDGLMAFDRMLDARCDAGEITAPTCKELNTLLVPVWDIKNNLNRTIAGGTSAVPVRLDQFQAAVKALIAKVAELVQGGAKDLLLRELNLAQTQ